MWFIHSVSDENGRICSVFIWGRSSRTQSGGSKKCMEPVHVLWVQERRSWVIARAVLIDRGGQCLFPYFWDVRRVSQMKELKTMDTQDSNFSPFQVKVFSQIVVVQLLSCVRLFATPRTVARQAPLSVGFPKQEHCSGLPGPPQRVFLTQGSNPHLLHCRQTLYC